MIPTEEELRPRADDLPEDDLSRQRIQEYVWARYIEFEAPAFEVDEERALAVLKEHYAAQPMAEDAECFYYGILAYERSFANPAQRTSYLRRAVGIFDAYRKQTSPDFRWDVVDDRYDDAVETLKREAAD